MAALSVFLGETSAADPDAGYNLDCDNPEDNHGDHQCYRCLGLQASTTRTKTI
jgi:hypothetical protein